MGSNDDVALPDDVKEECVRYVRILADAKKLHAEAEEMEKPAKEILQAYFNAYSVKKFEVEGVGSVQEKESRKETVQKDILIEQLLLHKMPLKEINAIMEKVVKVSRSVYVGFWKAKEK